MVFFSNKLTCPSYLKVSSHPAVALWARSGWSQAQTQAVIGWEWWVGWRGLTGGGAGPGAASGGGAWIRRAGSPPALCGDCSSCRHRFCHATSWSVWRSIATAARDARCSNPSCSATGSGLSAECHPGSRPTSSPLSAWRPTSSQHWCWCTTARLQPNRYRRNRTDVKTVDSDYKLI